MAVGGTSSLNALKRALLSSDPGARGAAGPVGAACSRPSTAAIDASRLRGVVADAVGVAGSDGGVGEE